MVPHAAGRKGALLARPLLTTRSMRPAFPAALGMNVAGSLPGDSHLAGSPWTIANGLAMDGHPVKGEVRPGAAHVSLLHGLRGNTIALPGPNGFAARFHPGLIGQRPDGNPGCLIPESR